SFFLKSLHELWQRRFGQRGLCSAEWRVQHRPILRHDEIENFQLRHYFFKAGDFTPSHQNHPSARESNPRQSSQSLWPDFSIASEGAIVVRGHGSELRPRFLPVSQSHHAGPLLTS